MMDVYINDHLTMKLVCLPQHLTELVLGRLLTEQIITSSEDVDHIYFFIELPSRRRLAYVRPKVEKDDNGKNIITYEGIDNSHKWNRLKTYGAKLVENITQGVARDLLLYAMQNMQDMEIVGHVHDEVIIECTPDVSVEQVCELMGQTPEWAEGLLLRADGYECVFYMKQ